MRIVLVTPEYPPADYLGGIGTHTAAVAPRLARRGHDVFVVTRGEEGDDVEDGVRVLRLDHRWIPNRPAETMLSRHRIARRVRALRPDVVQAPEWEAEGWWLARRKSPPLVTRLATPTYILDELNRSTLDTHARLIHALERDQARRSAALFAPTRAIVERVARDWELDAERIEIVPNPVDVVPVREAGTREAPLPLPNRFVAFFGRMERRKGIEVMAEALPSVLERHPGVEAVFIGRDPGDEGGELMQRFWRALGDYSQRVHVVGELRRADALAVVARAEVVVLPSLWENFANAALETMALGRPIIATRVGGFPEFIEEGSTGWLVPPGDSEALAAAIDQRLADPEETTRVAQAAYSAADGFSVESVADQLVGLYERVVHEADPFDASIYRRGYRQYFRADDPADPFHRLYEAKRHAVLEGLQGCGRQRVLDVGGGYGRLASALAADHDVTLVDVSPEMLEHARQRCPPSVELVEADARELPFADASFDVVLALDLLPHLPDLERGVAELARVARAGGSVVFDTTNAVPLWVLGHPSYVGRRPKRLLLTLLSGGVLPEWRRLVRHHRQGEVRRAIAAAGLQFERLETFGPRLAPKWHLWWTRRA